MRSFHLVSTALGLSLLVPTTTVLAGLGDLSDPQPVSSQECGIIDTIAGSEESGGFSGDGGPATSAEIYEARSVTLDALGNLYLVDGNNHRIRKVDMATGIIGTVAGTGQSGFSGDGGPAMEAQLSQPFWIAFDGNGNLYIVDRGNFRIRKVDMTTGIISTVAGTGQPTQPGSPSGDGSPATEVNITPIGIALDGNGDLYMSESARIRKVDITTGTMSTIAGTGLSNSCSSGEGGPAKNAQLCGAIGLVFDGNGDLYLSESHFGNGKILKVSMNTGTINTVAGTGEKGFSGDGGPAIEAQITAPHGLAFDGNGNLYIADYGNFRVRKVDKTTGIISTIAGTGQQAFSGDGGPATEADLFGPTGMVFDGMGNLYIADTNNHRVRKISCLAPPEAKVNELRTKKESGFVHPSRPPQQGRIVSPSSVGRAKAGTPPDDNRVQRKAAPVERAAAKPSLLQRIKSFLSPRKTGPTSEDIK